MLANAALSKARGLRDGPFIQQSILIKICSKNEQENHFEDKKIASIILESRLCFPLSQVLTW